MRSMRSRDKFPIVLRAYHLGPPASCISPSPPLPSELGVPWGQRLPSACTGPGGCQGKTWHTSVDALEGRWRGRGRGRGKGKKRSEAGRVVEGRVATCCTLYKRTTCVVMGTGVHERIILNEPYGHGSREEMGESSCSRIGIPVHHVARAYSPRLSD